METTLAEPTTTATSLDSRMKLDDPYQVCIDWGKPFDQALAEAGAREVDPMINKENFAPTTQGKLHVFVRVATLTEDLPYEDCLEELKCLDLGYDGVLSIAAFAAGQPQSITDQSLYAIGQGINHRGQRCFPYVKENGNGIKFGLGSPTQEGAEGVVLRKGTRFLGISRMSQRTPNNQGPQKSD